MAKKIWGGKKITEILQDAEEKQQKINSLFTSIQTTAEQINSIARQTDEKLANISTVANNVESSLSNVKGAVEEIHQLKTEVGELKSETSKLLEANQSLIEEIKNQLAVAAGGSLSNTFEKRKKELGDSKEKWFYWLMIDILILAGIAIFVFLELKNNLTITPGFLLKFSLSFPFIYAAVFFHSQYSKERELLEEYAFKSAVAFSFEAYRKILKEEINQEQAEQQNKFLEFIIDSIKKIYTSPREIISRHPNKENSVEMGILEKLVDIFKKFTK